MDDHTTRIPDLSKMNTDELLNQIVEYLKTIEDREKMHAIALTVYDYAFYYMNKDKDRIKYDEALKKQTTKMRLHIVQE